MTKSDREEARSLLSSAGRAALAHKEPATATAFATIAVAYLLLMIADELAQLRAGMDVLVEHGFRAPPRL